MVKVEKTTLDFCGHLIYWRKGSMPQCDCWFAKYIYDICPHVRMIASAREHGDEQFFFKSEGGKL